MKKIILLLFLSICCYSKEFLSNKIINDIQKKYGMTAKHRINDLQTLIINSKNKSTFEIIRNVNIFFNNFNYSSDFNIYGVEDYWSTPYEFIGKGKGDCEDFVLAKYFLLLYLDVSPKKLFITYVSVKNYSTAHMVLTFFDTPNSEPYVLDNFNKELLSSSKRKDLTPIYYFNPYIGSKKDNATAHKKWNQLLKNIKENKI